MHRTNTLQDVLLRVKGTAATRIVGADDAKIFQLLDVSLLRRPSSFLPADRERKLEFEICLRQEDNEEESFLPETYKGVWINVEYKVGDDERSLVTFKLNHLSMLLLVLLLLLLATVDAHILLL